MGKRFRSKSTRREKAHESNVVQAASGEPYAPGRLGAFTRGYPPKHMRDHTIDSIKRIPENERTPDQWWMLGEYQVFNGLLDESEAGVNEGIAALTAGATLPQPSVACLMDLGWILTSRGLDALALPYLHRAADMEPGSRDILAIKAIAEIGVGKGGKPSKRCVAQRIARVQQNRIVSTSSRSSRAPT